MRSFAAAMSILLALMVAVAPGHAETYPNRLIKIIVPFPVGGGADVLVRVLTQYMAEDLGQQFVVVNQPGASGALAFEQVARAAPDGYTLTWTSTAFPVMAATMPNLEFNPATDFTHIAEVAENPFILVINPQVPAQSVSELVALAKAKPNTLNFAHNGPGTLTRLALALFQQRTGIVVGNISYRGDNFSMADVINGQVQGMFSNAPVALPHIASGQVRGLAVTSSKRSATVPDLPTMAEAGIADFNVVVWHGLTGPAGLPRPIVDRLNAAMNKALGRPEVLAKLQTLGIKPVGGTPEEFQAVMQKELTFWASIAKQTDKSSD